MKFSTTFVLAAALGFTASMSAVAQGFIINDNLDANTPGGTTAGYTFGDVTNASHTYVSGAGVGGSIGAVAEATFLPPGVGYGGVAYQYQNGNVTGNTSANWSDYTLSFDAEVSKAGGGFSLNLQTWPGAGFGGTMTGQINAPAEITLSTANQFQHFSFSLGTFTGTAPAVATDKTWQLAFQMNESTFGGPGGPDQTVFDNIQVTMVPEPATFALAGMGAVALLALRRRR